MKKDTYKKCFVLITYTMVLALVMFNIKEIFTIVWGFLKLLSPLWIGIALAFTLNVPMSIIEREIFGKTDKKIRIFSLSASIAIIILLLLILFVWVIPDFIDSVSYLLGQIPSMIDGLNDILLNAFKNTDLSEYIKNFSGSSEVTSILSTTFRGIINNFSGFLSNFVTFVINMVTGIIIAIYFLLEKEHLLETMRSLIDKMFDRKLVKKMNKVFTLANKSFHDFITYQCLECLILGIMMFIAFIIFRFPYALTIAFLTTVTAIVPIFGATVACIIGAILIGTVSINQAIVFLIVFQVIQQIEGNVIYPKVVGKHVGLPPVVTILAIFIGGEVAGFFGMIICIPLTSILYSLFWTKFEDKKIGTKKEA
ncbi:MAG TPA: hypothetical protein DCY94_00065 [Firmicutes bacterium]|nr:hypothetical protein [Bacillota bacterium]